MDSMAEIPEKKAVRAAGEGIKDQFIDIIEKDMGKGEFNSAVRAKDVEYQPDVWRELK